MSATALHMGGAPTAREAGLWVGAAMMVLAAHALIGYGLHALRPVETTEAAEVALTIDLSPLAVTTPDSAESEALAGEIPQEVLEPVTETDEAPQEATVEEAQPVELAEAAPVETQVDPSEPVEPTEMAAIEPVDAVTPVEDETPLERTEAETVEPAEAETVETEPPPETVEPLDQPQIVETLEAEQVEDVLPEVIAALPEPKPILEEEPEPRPVKKAQPKPERKKPARKPPPKAEVAQKVQEAKVAKAAPSERSAKSNAAKAPTISPAKWQSRVIAWINRHKRYPSASKARGDEGRVQVNFAINAAGVVVSASIGRSSGDAALDQAALDMVRRASPVPAPPPEIARSRIQLALPVQFSLR